MPYESKTELIARLAKVDTALDAARTAESYGIGTRRKQMNMQALQSERREIIAKIEMIDNAQTGGFSNRVEFGRPD